MSERLFDAGKFRRARVVKGLTQAQVGEGLGIGGNVISRYEKGVATPPPEKLPRLAALLDVALDDLFPRVTLPDLADLRCDAGMTQAETAAITNTKSANPVSSAEAGARNLKAEYVDSLAAAYGVSPEELRAAEKRSFGEDAPPVPRTAEPAAPAQPQTIAEKIAYLLDSTAGQARPTDAELAALGNAKAGRTVLSGELVMRLRTGEETETSQDALDALAGAFDVPRVFFSSDDEDVARVIGSLRVADLGLKAMVARGTEAESQSVELLNWVADLIGRMHGGGEADRTSNDGR